MTPGFRYHVTTIAAIFLALGVGIIIGSSFVQSQIVERLTRRQEALGEQFRREIAPLRESNHNYAAFVESIAPRVIGNRLAGIRVAIVQTGDYPETTRHVRDALERAGSQVESVTVIREDFVDRAPEQYSSIAAEIKGHDPPSDVPAALGLLADSLGKLGHQSDVEALARAGLVESSGDYSKPVSFVILVGGAAARSGSRAEQIDLPLLAALKPLVRTVVAVEPSQADISYVESLRAANIPTVDNADTDIGRVAVVLALQGPSGDYGTKQSARNGTLPPIPSP